MDTFESILFNSFVLNRMAKMECPSCVDVILSLRYLQVVFNAHSMPLQRFCLCSIAIMHHLHRLTFTFHAIYVTLLNNGNAWLGFTHSKFVERGKPNEVEI